MGRKPFAARWKQSRKSGPIQAGRNSAHRFVSGGLCSGIQHTRQREVPAIHEKFGPPQQVTHLRAEFAILVPAQDDGFEAEQGLGDIAMRRS